MYFWHTYYKFLALFSLKKLCVTYCLYICHTLILGCKLDFETFDIKLDTEFIGRNFIYLEEIDSTNTFLLSQQELKHGTVAFAESQTNGRGRLDRKWISQPGVNLLFSIFLNPSEIDVKKIQLYNLATSLSIAFSIENLLQIPTNLKWPNDVLIGKKKVSGILLESSSLGEKINKIVVGIGVNVNQPYFQGKYLTEPTSLKLESKQLVSREKLFAEILNNFERLINYISGKPEKIINEWKNKCKMIGDTIFINTGSQEISGKFYDIDELGQLLLKHKDGAIQTISYGDISL